MGESKLKYIKDPRKTDDVIHAINFAYHMGRIFFGEPLTDDHATLNWARRIATNSQSGMGYGTVQSF